MLRRGPMRPSMPEHDPEKWNRFSEKIMLQDKGCARRAISRDNCAPEVHGRRPVWVPRPRERPAPKVMHETRARARAGPSATRHTSASRDLVGACRSQVPGLVRACQRTRFTRPGHARASSPYSLFANAGEAACARPSRSLLACPPARCATPRTSCSGTRRRGRSTHASMRRRNGRGTCEQKQRQHRMRLAQHGEQLGFCGMIGGSCSAP